ncbi:hypothetical protein NP233_g2711 [Leucocoprinus birnbaumii]|uniref:ATP-dependent DNA helicase n=1 Tax=Leucocoprinus birnbaumii TaxID=56174 RepID=A0AAD5W1P8_9AGAR|nr:hypothetical protein NP233_g2711 [Leucocoprinus birnbaumii]
MTSHSRVREIEMLLEKLTTREIWKDLPHPHPLSYAMRRNRDSVFNAVLAYSPEELDLIHAAASELIGRDSPKKRRTIRRKRTTHISRVDDRERDDQPVTRMDEEPSVDQTVPPNFDDFLNVVDDDVIMDAFRRFSQSTGNSALAVISCSVCARRTPQDHITNFHSPTDIPNHTLLKPQIPQPMHSLFEGMLIHGQASEGRDANVCSECLAKLKRNRLPPLALANGMWVGDVPFELEVLSLAEKILVARYYSAAYIIKLYPRDASVKYWDTRTLNSGLKGNVSTYPLDTQEISRYMNEEIMPPRSSVLSATIGITFIGPRGFPERTMPDTVKVRRARVRDALVWLKRHNPLYRDIIVSEERLGQLPIDGVPEEIRSTAKYSTDLDMVMKEHESYVPGPPFTDQHEEEATPEDAEQGTQVTYGVNDIVACDSESGSESGSLEEEGTAPDIVPLQAQGVVDVTGRSITDSEILAHAFSNTALNGSGTQNLHESVTTEDQAIPTIFSAVSLGYFLTVVVVSRWIRHQNAIARLTETDFLQASTEEIANRPISNPIMRSLREEVTTVRVQIAGTDESRISIRRKIWGATVMFGPPSIWLTINPSDTHDPIAQVLAGEDIDLDEFDRHIGPTTSQRALNIAQDPLAAAEFFHRVVTTMLEGVFGITGVKGVSHVKRRKGILGTIRGYVGTVEAQFRGTLHLHAILWLEGAPSAHEVAAVLQNPTFRERVRAFIRAHISADVGNMDAEEFLRLPRQPDISYSRPLDPSDPDFEVQCKEREMLLARSVQVHKCSTNTCLRTIKGRLVCKRRAPFELSSREWITPDGRWGPKRTCGYVNNYNRCILQLLRANHDIKLVTNGAETRDISWYITNYAAKKQKRSGNISALLAKRFAFHQKQEAKSSDIQQIHKRLIERCANTLSRDQEFSAPEVISYLMGWGDRYVSHFYVKIFWDPVREALMKAYPVLSPRNMECGETSQTQKLVIDNGNIRINDQLSDYISRGHSLNDYSFLDFMLDTYEGKHARDDGEQRRGRRPNTRVGYLGDERKHRCRIVRRAGHETLPEFIGKWLPRNDRPEDRELYCASILVLFKPWRSWSDIPNESNSFDSEFCSFITTSPLRIRRIIDNIQYYYTSMEGASKNTDSSHVGGPIINIQDDGDNDVLQNTDLGDENGPPEATEADVEAARRNTIDARQFHFGQKALDIAYDIGLFIDPAFSHPRTVETLYARGVTDIETSMIEDWRGQLHQATHEISTALPMPAYTTPINVANLPNTIPSVIRHDLPFITNSVRMELDILNNEQRRAHDIIERHLLSHLNGFTTTPLLMLCLGEGGTGKTTVINAITSTFREHNVEHLLAKTATSGVAATLIGGETLHSWLGVGVGMPKTENWLDKGTKTARERRSRNISGKLLLLIDECSMLTSEFLGLASEVISGVRIKDGDTRQQDIFAGLSVVLFGDFHQFPPVSRPKLALYRQTTHNKRAVMGHEIYRRFTTVVILQKQNRVKDSRWMLLLRNLREGTCSKADIEIVKSLVLTMDSCQKPDFNSLPWKDAILVTSRRVVKDMWNQSALMKHSHSSGNAVYVSPADDQVLEGHDVRHPSMHERVVIAGTKVEDTQRLAERVELAVRMKAMVLLNISTDADLANGTRGVIEDICLDPRETDSDMEQDDEGRVLLRFPPVLIKFRPDLPTDIRFTGLEDGIIPITPSEVRFTLEASEGKKFRVWRRQLALTQAYAFTDYKSQGQTIPYVIVDMATPPGRGSKLTPFNAYVALSRSRGRDSIRLLRHPDISLFTNHPCEYLREEDTRLVALAEETAQRTDR